MPDDVKLDALTELAERCEKATGPDRELDLAIYDWLRENAGHLPSLSPPLFTASLDAAMTLVPEGTEVAMQSFGGPGPMALVKPNERFVSGKTLPLALCAAALRARGQSHK